MKIIISNNADRPLYQQIEDQIKDAILKEELVEGDALPSIRAFANDLKVSVLTIRRVYEELEREGFVTSQVGIGTFVSAGNLDAFAGFQAAAGGTEDVRCDTDGKIIEDYKRRIAGNDGNSLRGGYGR